MSFRTIKNYTTIDGHRYTSTKTTVPLVWHRFVDGDTGLMNYASGDYQIQREPHLSRFMYRVFRDGQELSLSWTSSLREAKWRARMNAEGRDVFNWA